MLEWNYENENNKLIIVLEIPNSKTNKSTPVMAASESQDQR
jgi:hypothetical protein